MAESVAPSLHPESEQQSSETTLRWPRKIKWGSRSCPVAAVQPTARNEKPETSELRSAPSPVHPSIEINRSSPGSPQLVSAFNRSQLDRLRQQPFSFDERDSLQRVARERRLEQLREEKTRIMGSRFQANPVRKYKPLVIQQSTRPPTVPRSPFSHARR